MLLLYGEAVTSGVKGIFTMHGKTMEDIKNNKDVYKLIETNQLTEKQKLLLYFFTYSFFGWIL